MRLIIILLMAILWMSACATVPKAQQAQAQAPQQDAKPVVYRLTTLLDSSAILKDLETMPVQDLVRLLVYDHAVRLTNRTNRGQVALTNILGERLVPERYVKQPEPVSPEVPEEAPKTEEKVHSGTSDNR